MRGLGVTHSAWLQLQVATAAENLGDPSKQSVSRTG